LTNGVVIPERHPQIEAVFAVSPEPEKYDELTRLRSRISHAEKDLGEYLRSGVVVLVNGATYFVALTPSYLSPRRTVTVGATVAVEEDLSPTERTAMSADGP
jgi:hypothetical protein